MTTLVYRHQRPVMGLPYDPPHLTRGEIERLIEGTFAGSHPATASIIDDIQSLQNAMAGIEKRRDAEGKLSERDERDLRVYNGPRAQKYRMLNLHPAEVSK
jgi:hypothetical protein